MKKLRVEREDETLDLSGAWRKNLTVSPNITRARRPGSLEEMLLLVFGFLLVLCRGENPNKKGSIFS
jgi:hypothetical protein